MKIGDIKCSYVFLRRGGDGAPKEITCVTAGADGEPIVDSLRLRRDATREASAGGISNRAGLNAKTAEVVDTVRRFRHF
jgi:hypothetical protein